MRIIVIMKFVLSSQNVYDYLIDQKICDRLQENPGVEQIQAKNFNAVVENYNGETRAAESGDSKKSNGLVIGGLVAVVVTGLIASLIYKNKVAMRFGNKFIY